MKNSSVENCILVEILGNRLTFRVSEVAEFLGVSENTLRRAIAAGLVKTIRVGAKRIVISRNELMRLLTEGMQAPRGEMVDY